MTRRAFTVASVVAVLALTPAAADWLVTRDGTRIETRGPWQVEGRQVIFTAPDGRLSALRVADVDLEASAAANREAAAGAEAAEETAAVVEAAESRPRKSVLVLTDENIGSAEAEDLGQEGEDLEDEADATGEGSTAEDAPSGLAEREPVELVSWRSHEDLENNGMEILGRVRNAGQGIAAAIRVTVKVPGEEGQPPFDVRAFLDATALAPGQATDFRALLPGIYSLPGDPSFEIESEGLSIQGPASSGSPEDETEPGEADDLQNEPPRR